jgi:hypothetical protein
VAVDAVWIKLVSGRISLQTGKLTANSSFSLAGRAVEFPLKYRLYGTYKGIRKSAIKIEQGIVFGIRDCAMHGECKQPTRKDGRLSLLRGTAKPRQISPGLALASDYERPSHAPQSYLRGAWRLQRDVRTGSNKEPALLILAASRNSSGVAWQRVAIGPDKSAYRQ